MVQVGVEQRQRGLALQAVAQFLDQQQATGQARKRVVHWALGGAAQVALDPCQQFGDIKGLGDIVVCPVSKPVMTFSTWAWAVMISMGMCAVRVSLRICRMAS
ncbi:MAG: hypothetical protein OHK0022_57350 [Roseiflexaceae bacterium]